MRSIWTKIKTKYKWLVAVILAAGVGSAATVGVLAVVPDTNGVIHACYRTGGLAANGAVRIINSPTQSCNSNETAIAWNEATPGQFLKNLVGADFSNASLQYRNFAGRDMHNGNFGSTNFTGADLRGVNFSGSNMSGVILTNADASSANFSNGSILIRDATNANLQNARLDGSTIEYLYNGNYQDASFDNVTFSEQGGIISSNMSGVDFRSVHFTGIFTVQGTNFTQANFSGLTMNSVAFINNSDVSNADFSGVTFIGGNGGGVYNDTAANNTNFTNASFDGVTFLGTNLSTANLAGTTWSNVTCPDGTNSDNNGNTCIGHLVP